MSLINILYEISCCKLFSLMSVINILYEISCCMLQILYLVAIITLSMILRQNLHDSNSKLLFCPLSYCMRIQQASLKIVPNLRRLPLIGCVKWPTSILTQSDETFPSSECPRRTASPSCARVIQRLVLSITSGIDSLIHSLMMFCKYRFP